MFMEIAVGAIGIGIVLMVGYIVIAQVRAALPTASNMQVANPCLGLIGIGSGSGTCVNTSLGSYMAPTICGDTNISAIASANTTAIISCQNVGATTGTAAVQVTVFAGFGLIAVGIIVLAAFGLISIFK